MKIDLVYPWVDGNDPEWQTKKAQQLNPGVHEKAVQPGRFFDNEELRYSLRSLERNAPWINHIYIVTDNQKPVWLNCRHPKITLVDHREIIPKEYLPTFNSNVIEWHYPFIPGLSEHFLLANDDFFFGRRCEPKHFFDTRGNPIENCLSYEGKEDIWPSFYGQTLLYTIDCFTQKTGQSPTFKQAHVFYPQRKSYILDVREKFAQELAEVYSHHFRKENDIPYYLVSLYDHAMGRRSLVYPGRKMMERLFRESRAVFLSPERASKDLFKLRLRPPRIFCVNDGDDTTDACRQKARRFFESFFPKKSTFEL